tara:strand:+ start:1533 stop:2237 length:705 start_codon:yes stop_codon:yes gene_type:complete
MKMKNLTFIDGTIGTTFERDKYMGDFTPVGIDLEFDRSVGVTVIIENLAGNIGYEFLLWDSTQKPKSGTYDAYFSEVGKGDLLDYLKTNNYRVDDVDAKSHWVEEFVSTQKIADYHEHAITDGIVKGLNQYFKLAQQAAKIDEMVKNNFANCKNLKQLCDNLNLAFDFADKYRKCGVGAFDYGFDLYSDVSDYAGNDLPTFGGQPVEAPDIYSYDPDSYLQLDPDGFVIIERDE